RFGDDLDFSVRLVGGQQLARGKADQQLSAGARDQLYLAVRLAVSEFLSRGQTPLPLLLDDVFVSSDDERARAGMRLLIERFAPVHQVVLLTCHRRRFEALAELDRDLYSGRVQWLDARSIGALHPSSNREVAGDAGCDHADDRQMRRGDQYRSRHSLDVDGHYALLVAV